MWNNIKMSGICVITDPGENRQNRQKKYLRK